MFINRAYRNVALAATLVLGTAALCFGWGDDGHKAIATAAAKQIPADMPAFFAANSSQIIYNAPEPDRWRSNLEKPLVEAQAPDHFMDMEYVDWMKKLPSDRYQFIRAVYEYRAKHPEAGPEMYPEKIGFQPYIVIEVYGRLKVAFREYRHAKTAGLSTAGPEADVIFYAGWLSHYVGDGANPMHTSKQYNGWTGPNPNGYTTQHDIHYKFESGFVRANLADLVKFDDRVKAPKHLDDAFDDYVAYLRRSLSLVEPAYKLDKACAFDGKGTAEGHDFVKERFASGAQMLVDLWYTAWLDSAVDPEVYHAPKREKAPDTRACATTSSAEEKE